MLLREFATRLDDLFEIERYPEPDGWDFAMSGEEKQALLRRASFVFARTFNGLLLGRGLEAAPVERVHLLVFPERSLIDEVVAHERARSGHGAVIVTHHPVDMETSGRGFVAIPKEQLHELEELGISMYVLHAALDCNAEISTSRALADGLGLTVTEQFAPYVKGRAGVIGDQAPESFESFAERVRVLCELPFFPPDQVRFNGRDVTRVAIVAGGGDDAAYLAEAEAKGADCYVAGHWWTPHPGEWSDQNRKALREAVAQSHMNLLSASHDGSELVVFRDRLLPLFDSWGLATTLLRQSDHWR